MGFSNRNGVLTMAAWLPEVPYDSNAWLAEKRQLCFTFRYGYS